MILKSLIAALIAAAAFISVYSQPQRKQADDHYARGNEHLNAGRFDQALDEYSRAIALDPRFVDAMNNKGIVYKRKGEYDLAIAEFDQAIKLMPKDADLYSNRASVYWLQKKYDAAAADYETAIRLSENKHIYYLRRADMRLEQPRFDAAIEDYTKAIAIDARQGGTYLSRGVAYARSGRLVESLKDYRTAVARYTDDIAKSPTNIDSLFNRGIALANLEDFTAAINNFTAAINLDPEKAVNVYYERANAYEAIMDFERAKADRRKYTQLGGSRPSPQPRRGFYPNASFDEQAARVAFGRGNSVVQGIVCTRYSGKVYRAAGARVSIFPVTPYLDTWYKLREKKESKDTAVFMSNEAVRWRVDVIANNEGRFYFADLKPGRYFIQVFHNFTSRHYGREARGSSTEVINGVLTTTNYYQDYDYTVGHNGRIEKFVDIKQDGDEEKVTVMRGGGLLKFGGCA